MTWDHLKDTPDDVVIDNFDFGIRLSASLIAQVPPEEIRRELRRFYEGYWRKRVEGHGGNRTP